MMRELGDGQRLPQKLKPLKARICGVAGLRATGSQQRAACQWTCLRLSKLQGAIADAGCRLPESADQANVSLAWLGVSLWVCDAMACSLCAMIRSLGTLGGGGVWGGDMHAYICFEEHYARYEGVPQGGWLLT